MLCVSVCVQLGLPLGCIKATVLIENVLAAFEMEEILYELRDHSAGLNCGIWDYSASFVNKFGEANMLAHSFSVHPCVSLST